MNGVISLSTTAADLVLATALQLLDEGDEHDHPFIHDGVLYMVSAQEDAKTHRFEVIVFEAVGYVEGKTKKGNEGDLLGIAALWLEDDFDPDSLRYTPYGDDDAKLSSKAKAMRSALEAQIGLEHIATGELSKAA